MKNDQKQVPITVFDLSNQLDDWFQRGDALSHFNSDFLETSLFFIIFAFCFSSLLNLCFFSFSSQSSFNLVYHPYPGPLFAL